jgi:DNA-binding transcriptional regulator YhcF (GntR family)
MYVTGDGQKALSPGSGRTEPSGSRDLLSAAPQLASEESLAHQIYRGIRGKIISGALPQGSRLRERELAEEFRVSRVPLREAFPQLEADGFIQSSPRRGVRVTSLTLKDATTRRTDQDDEFLVRDVEVDTADRQNLVVFLDDVTQRYLSHLSLTLWSRRPSGLQCNSP